MNKNVILSTAMVAFVVGSGLVCSCKGSGQDKPAAVSTAPSAARDTNSVIKEREVTIRGNALWGGKKVKYVIQRKPCEDAFVKDEFGTKHQDNVMTLKVLDSNSQELFNKTFRKVAFKPYMDSRWYDKYILEGLVFDKDENGKLIFAVSVANPTSEDEYLPFKITLLSNGNYSIERDEDLDTSSLADDEEDVEDGEE